MDDIVLNKKRTLSGVSSGDELIEFTNRIMAETLKPN